MADIANFDLSIAIPKTEWLVDGLIPLGHLGFVIAQAGIGKSYLMEQLAACVVYGKPFLGLTVKPGNVLLIDQDTPENALFRRLQKFMAHYKNEDRIGELKVKSMMGMKLSEGNLMGQIVENDDSTLVIIDSFNAVCGDLNPNSTGSMSRLQMLKQNCLREHMTILINHHISEKTTRSAHDLMTCDPHILAMGSSVINQQADSYYIIGAPDHLKNRLETLYVRPVGKRELIPLAQFKTSYIEEDGYSYFTNFALLDIKADLLDDVEADIMTLYKTKDNDEKVGRTVNEVTTQLEGKHGMNVIRVALKQLETKGKMKCTKSKHNLFKYFLITELEKSLNKLKKNIKKENKNKLIKKGKIRKRNAQN